MTQQIRLLIIEGNTEENRKALVAAGGHIPAELYSDVLKACMPGIHTTTIQPADVTASLPSGETLASYDGIVLTGSSLNIYNGGPSIERQIDLVRAIYKIGVPLFGSCWAAQVATVAAGGDVQLNPKGREIGIARKVTLTEAGRQHPLHQGKAPVFDAICVHKDAIVALPPKATVLASNSFSAIQSLEIQHENGVFWGVQYHPEYDLREIGRVTFRYGDALVNEGLFKDHQAVENYVTMMETLSADPKRHDLAWLLGIDADILDPVVRRQEVSNWLTYQVKPYIASRH
ncbi:MAG: type 1 glutamine amidotransferase [Alphaproteobacteria bacterium]